MQFADKQRYKLETQLTCLSLFVFLKSSLRSYELYARHLKTKGGGGVIYWFLVCRDDKKYFLAYFNFNT